MDNPEVHTSTPKELHVESAGAHVMIKRRRGVPWLFTVREVPIDAKSWEIIDDWVRAALIPE